MAIPIAKSIEILLHPKRIFVYYYRGIDFWPPKNFSKRYQFRFYLLELPLRWIFKAVFPQNWDGSQFRTFFDEDVYIDNFFLQENFQPKTFVDIGAGDGIDMSNTFKLANRGLTGLAIEGNPLRFSQLSLTYEKYRNMTLIRSYVSAESVGGLINGAGIPNNFDVLNLDIDSYDYHVLESILNEFNPKLCVLEWNRSYPPTIFFTVNNDPNIRWDLNSRLMAGGSLLAFYSLLQQFNYKIIGVQGAAIFAVPTDSSPNWLQLSINDSWNQYIQGPSKWVDTDEGLLSMSKEGAIQECSIGLQKFNGHYVIH